MKLITPQRDPPNSNKVLTFLLDLFLIFTVPRPHLEAQSILENFQSAKWDLTDRAPRLQVK